MNRRGFLGSLAGLLSTAVLDPEQLLWLPGKKTIFIPPVNVVTMTDWDMINAMTKKYITPDLVRSVFESNPFLSYRYLDLGGGRDIQEPFIYKG